LPNAAHHALAALQAMGRLACCITQNVDGLHQRAGLAAEALIEVHGNATRVRCLDCGAAWPRAESTAGWTPAPPCRPARRAAAS
jgi:NAD-dependent deacetylase